ncbi:16S rRNA (guanine(966)-N(2))-methyltransferase RsmD [Stenotrophomonas sp. MMGLT7]|uniref:16S rRNA (guanine(966)-N(2))-methyltransferase RsmD n=1 Tax=Stenotrophomonas sp. MMGLT7 TaxID=2901227 RepID=UPI001E56EA6D|nr:16S rRNA (guanine(966)-N(2))-methyltransferase RsmD [Stenotrophomonas sp. MMGLT7]MCD7097144.1 16S rRNA (guanine(966)-N(2))-methyltransferase RsmD [Stenotrophomonas sp. MMGLT7]
MKRPSRPPAAPASGQVRIIGGRWRNTRLPVADLAGLRPTGDRVRETLFNWLMPKLPGARVLDLFAGSGVLGLEAVSRGAASAVLVERDPGQAARLREAVGRLDAATLIEVVQGDALAWLAGVPAAGFDIAFLDPPFAAGLLPATLPALAPRLAPGAWVYVEAPEEPAALPAGWTPHRQGRTRETCYTLYRTS